jgi:hypothetical protein
MEEVKSKKVDGPPVDSWEGAVRPKLKEGKINEHGKFTD